MKKLTRKFAKVSMVIISAAALALILGLYAPIVALAEEADARALVKAMSDYMASQKAISFAYDANLEVVTADHQKLTLASSGMVTLNRPDKLRATRSGGFADIEIFFDAKTLTMFGKNTNLYAQIDIPGTIDHLIDELKDKHNRPLPAADLLMTNVNDELMAEVIDVKDIGSGVIGGTECDHFAFRTKDVDWQIWIAQGDHPYPCRYVITSKLVAEGPQYSIQFSDWKTGNDVAADSFSFKNPTKAKKIDLEDVAELADFPKNFTVGGAK
jgi:hypothetical protein